MLCKLQQTQEILKSKGVEAALRFAAKLGCLGKYRDAIQKGAAALTHPDFYRELGQDPKELVQRGIESLQTLLSAS